MVRGEEGVGDETSAYETSGEGDHGEGDQTVTVQSPESAGSDAVPPATTAEEEEEHFRPTGTVFLLAAFVLTLILLWLSVYVILISRGVTA